MTFHLLTISYIQRFSSFCNAVLNRSSLSDKIIRSSAHRRDPMGEPSFSCGGGGGGGLVSLELNKSSNKSSSCEKEVRPAVRMAAVFAGLACTALQMERFAIGAKTELGLYDRKSDPQA